MNACPNCGTQSADGQKFCTNCGFPLEAGAQAAQQANAYQQAYQQQPYQPVDANVSPKSRLAALLLCIFVGELGVHRFYVGKIGTGILWLLTLGFGGIGALVDLILIAMGSFTDGDGLPVSEWQM